MSSEIELVDSDQFEKIEEVASLRLQGHTEYAIARRLGIPQKVVKERYNLWKDMLNKDTEARDAARDHLNLMVQHYDKLVNETYKVLDDLKSMSFDEKVAAQMNTSLKNIADYESRRVDALQKAGLLENSELGDELAEREENEKILVDILRNDLCPVCKPKVMRRLKEVTGQVEPLREESDVIDVEVHVHE